MNQPQPESALSPSGRLAVRLAQPVDGASLAVFRMAFGVIIGCEAVRYFLHGWIARYYIEPSFHFTYFGFGWVHPWPGVGMYVHFVVLGLAALCVAVGLWYRWSAILLWLSFTYVFLLDQARYLNHFYAVSLIAFLLAIMPAARVWSVDAWLRRRRGGGPLPPVIPQWSVWLLRFQIGVIYFFGGIAKMSSDWIHGEPMRSWLLDRSDAPLINLIVQHQLELYVFSFGGLFFDLLVAPALLWRRTRPFAFAAAIMFHTINSQIFSIGIFPWMMIAATTIFFDEDWPRRIAARMRLAAAGPVTTSAMRLRVSPAMLTLIAVYAFVQIAVPLRHFLYPGDVSWTEEGHRFSWQMKLREKSGEVLFFVNDQATHQLSIVRPETVIEPWQASRMATRPDMLLQFAHHLADLRSTPGHRVEVRARAMVSLNRRESRLLVDPNVDLAAQPRTLATAVWVTRGTDLPEEPASGQRAAGIP